MDRILFLPDVHVPYEDKQALNIAKQFQSDFKPHYTVQLGDLLTCDQVSSYPNDCTTDLKDEFKMGRDFLDRFNVTHFLAGNHEERLSRPSLVKKTLRSAINVEDGLRLEEKGILHRPYDNTKGIFRFGKLTALHGSFTNEYAARKHADAYGACIFGHTHRIQVHQPKHAFSSHRGYNIGCLCRLDLAYRVAGAPSGWGQGFAFGYFQKSGHFNLYMVSLIGDRININGTTYRRSA